MDDTDALQPRLIEVLPQRVAYLVSGGAMSELPQSMMDLVSWIVGQGLPTEDVLIGCTHDFRAAGQAGLVWEVWGTLPDSVPEQEGEDDEPGIKTIPGFTGAVVVNIGPYGQTRDTYQRLLAWLEDGGYRPEGPVYELYRSDPALVPESRLETEIRVPILGRADT